MGFLKRARAETSRRSSTTRNAAPRAVVRHRSSDCWRHRTRQVQPVRCGASLSTSLEGEASFAGSDALGAGHVEIDAAGGRGAGSGGALVLQPAGSEVDCLMAA